MRALMEQPPITEADDGFRQPTTFQEWRSWKEKRPKLMIRNHDAGGTNWLPGYELFDVYGGDLLTVLCPKSRQPITVKLTEAKIWKKDLWKQDQLREATRLKNEKKTDTRVELAPTNLKDPTRIVIYVPSTGGFVGGSNGRATKRIITATLDDADSYQDHKGAFGTRARMASAFHGVKVEYMTRAAAAEMVVKRFEEQEATQSALDNLAKDHAKEAEEAAKYAAELAAKPKMVDVPEPVVYAPPPPPVIAKVEYVTKPTTPPEAPRYSEIEQAIMDEAECEVMALEAKGRRIRAEARAKIEAMRKAAL